MAGVLHYLLVLNGPVAYFVIFTVVFLESAVFLGVVLPGETAVAVGGILASVGSVSLWGMILCSSLAAVSSYAVGYELGRRYGDGFISLPFVRRWTPGVEKSKTFLRDRGSWSVLFSRFVPVVRTAIPGLSGMARAPYGRFTVLSTLGGAAWGLAFTLLGYVAGEFYIRFESLLSVGCIAVVVLVVVGWFVWKRIR